MISTEQVYELVKSGQWTFEQFKEWSDNCQSDSHSDGYDEGYSDGYDEGYSDGYDEGYR